MHGFTPAFRATLDSVTAITKMDGAIAMQQAKKNALPYEPSRTPCHGQFGKIQGSIRKLRYLRSALLG